MREYSTGRATWKKYIGSIPVGYEIHHVNFDRSDNSIFNLVCILKEVHRQYHNLRGRLGPWKSNVLDTIEAYNLFDIWVDTLPLLHEASNSIKYAEYQRDTELQRIHGAQWYGWATQERIIQQMNKAKD